MLNKLHRTCFVHVTEYSGDICHSAPMSVCFILQYYVSYMGWLIKVCNFVYSMAKFQRNSEKTEGSTISRVYKKTHSGSGSYSYSTLRAIRL